ncbi:hypothetical protein BC937DRAFT_89056 [Endogone sp. FLAS-F59071]|nr:hypothetical protein BC937DRAFT_89056 [Endogone sp. FLAS-F59071]|eukprot:RUS18184.1 hypothetical protein BC937DRAFT_89056 [Endogone sp. FLAS-F59071]
MSRLFTSGVRAATRAAQSRGYQALVAVRPYSLLTRPATMNTISSAVKLASTQTRTLKTLDFGGTQEVVYERDDYPSAKLLETFKNDTIAVLGYGPQGHGQALNMRDNGLNVIVGARRGRSYDKAVNEGWIPGKTLFSISEASEKGTIIMNLLSDASQRETWPEVKKYLTKGKTLYFSHGFSIVYKDQTNVVPPADIDVILIAEH